MRTAFNLPKEADKVLELLKILDLKEKEDALIDSSKLFLYSCLKTMQISDAKPISVSRVLALLSIEYLKGDKKELASFIMNISKDLLKDSMLPIDNPLVKFFDSKLQENNVNAKNSEEFKLVFKSNVEKNLQLSA